MLKIADFFQKSKIARSIFRNSDPQKIFCGLFLIRNGDKKHHLRGNFFFPIFVDFRAIFRFFDLVGGPLNATFDMPKRTPHDRSKKRKITLKSTKIEKKNSSKMVF